jgi:HEPN/Toprim N-terminal domain 1
MGTYAYLRVGDYPLASTKSEVDPTVIMLFTEGDKRVRVPTPVEQAQYAGEPEAFIEELIREGGEYDDERPFSIVEYAASLAVVRDRLDLMGYTLTRVRREFAEGMEEHIGNLVRYSSDPHFSDSEAVVSKNREKIDLLRRVDLERWLEAFKYILEHNLQPGYEFRDHGPTDGSDMPPLVRYLLTETRAEGVWTPFYDSRCIMRAVVEVTGVDVEVVYDLTEFVFEETLDPDEDLCSWARRQTTEEFIINHKLVVLTEGSTDKWAIEGAFKLLYPHLTEYFSFMDFGTTKAPGSAGQLVATLKAFAGAGIVNRTIALFDNDTAARDALRGLRGVKLPENFRVVHYPDVEWARSFPTLGPQGLSHMDVNGLAGSLEMYFGSDVLLRSDGSLTPVQWRGYVEGVKQYQGELMRKANLQEKFASKLRECRKDPAAVARYDWSGMRAIIDAIRTAFHDVGAASGTLTV